MPRDRISRTAFLIALLVHVLVVAPVWGGFELGRTGPTPPPDPPPLQFSFVDPPEAPEEAPPEPTPLLSSRDSRAAQPETVDRPPGAAFQEGRTPIPQRARPLGSQARPGDVASRSATSPWTPEEGRERPAPDGERGVGPVRPGIGAAIRRGAPPASPLPAPATDQRSSTARAGATYSLNTTAWEYGPYMERLKRQIERHIFPPPAFYYGAAAWITRVRFRIASDGRLEALELLDHEGVRNLQYVALSAVEGAAEFEPLPPDFPEPYLEITGGFYFNSSPAGP